MTIEAKIAAGLRFMRQWDPEYAAWAEREYARILKPFAPARAVSQGVA